MIRGVFLDLGWTLLRPAFNNWFINQKMLEFTSLDKLASLPQEKRDTVFDKAIKYLQDNHTLTTEEEEVEQFTEFYKILATGLPELGIRVEQAEEIAVFKVYDTSYFIFFDKTKDTLLKLRKKYKLGIISDTWPSADRILKNGGIEDLFDTKTFSCHLGVMKPDSKMYYDALKQMGLPPEQTIFVDDFEPNLDGAAACGIKSVLIKEKANALILGQSFTDKMIDNGKYPSINSIEELPALIEKEEIE